MSDLAQLLSLRPIYRTPHTLRKVVSDAVTGMFWWIKDDRLYSAKFLHSADVKSYHIKPKPSLWCVRNNFVLLHYASTRSTKVWHCKDRVKELRFRLSNTSVHRVILTTTRLYLWSSEGTGLKVHWRWDYKTTIPPSRATEPCVSSDRNPWQNFSTKKLEVRHVALSGNNFWVVLRSSDAHTLVKFPEASVRLEDVVEIYRFPPEYTPRWMCVYRFVVLVTCVRAFADVEMIYDKMTGRLISEMPVKDRKTIENQESSTGFDLCRISWSGIVREYRLLRPYIQFIFGLKVAKSSICTASTRPLFEPQLLRLALVYSGWVAPQHKIEREPERQPKRQPKRRPKRQRD